MAAHKTKPDLHLPLALFVAGASLLFPSSSTIGVSSAPDVQRAALVALHAVPVESASDVKSLKTIERSITKIMLTER